MGRNQKHIRDIVAYARDMGIRNAKVEQRGRHPHLLGTKPNGSALRFVLSGVPRATEGEAGAIPKPTSEGRSDPTARLWQREKTSRIKGKGHLSVPTNDY
jgi:hypothetical protein